MMTESTYKQRSKATRVGASLAVAQRQQGSKVLTDNRTETSSMNLMQLAKTPQTGAPAPKSKGKGIAKNKSKHQKGTYAYRNKERKALEKNFDSKIDGNSTHQSEHVVGYKVVDEVTDRKSAVGKVHEAEAPAYYERYDAHRDHPGTGTSKTVGDSGFSSQTYRQDTRKLVEDGEYGLAVQVNQLGYGFQSDEVNPKDDSKAFHQANDSYNTMVMNTNDFSHYSATGDKKTQSVSFQDKAEMLLARAVQNKTLPYPYTETQAAQYLMKHHGIDLADPRFL
jgi:hypothetical protein